MAGSKYIHKSHNISVLLYHVVCAAKCRRVVFSAHVDEVVREACPEIAKRYEMIFLEIGADQDQVHCDKNGRCVDSNPLAMPNGFSRCTFLLTISFISGNI